MHSHHTPHHGRGEYSSEVDLWYGHFMNTKFGYFIQEWHSKHQTVLNVLGWTWKDIYPWPTQTMKLIHGYCSWSVAQDAAHNHPLRSWSYLTFLTPQPAPALHHCYEVDMRIIVCNYPGTDTQHPQYWPLLIKNQFRPSKFKLFWT